MMSSLWVTELWTFLPVIYNEDGALVFQSEDTSFSVSARSVSMDFWVERKLEEIFPDNIRKAQWKPIRLHEPMNPNWFFWLKRNHDEPRKWKKAWTIIGFKIQYRDQYSWKNTQTIDETRATVILEIMIEKYGRMKENFINPEEALNYFMSLLRTPSVPSFQKFP